MTGPLPETFGRYRILRPLGGGGMGAVYLARDTLLDRLVALKTPRVGDGDTLAPHDLDRFVREACVGARLTHPNLCPIFDVGQVDGTPYLTMPYLEGRPLRDLTQRGTPISEHEAVLIVCKLARALQYAHTRNVIHRDLKPSNVMLTEDGEPVVMDFGLARRDPSEGPPPTQPGIAQGTPAYMAPEQVRGDPRQIGAPCDIYALGVILYQLLTGRLPFEGPPYIVLDRIWNENPLPPSNHRPGLAPELTAICLKAMAKKVEDRYASMAELAAALTDHFSTFHAVFGPAVDARTAAEPGPRASNELATVSPPYPEVEPEYITTRIGQIKLEHIPAGTFHMGSPMGEGEMDEHPRHEVRISRPFYLGVHAVTQAQYQAVIGRNPSWFSSTGRGKDAVAGLSTEQHPVESTSWLDAIKFCNALSQQEDLKAFYEIDGETVGVPDWNGPGFRLPTEAEWEYACRAGSAARYGYGDDERELFDYAWFSGNAQNMTHPVGQTGPNAWSLHDMHGNVWEWCWDVYDADYYKVSGVDDPHGPDPSRKVSPRTLRGGCWSGHPWVCRSAFRNGYLPGAWYGDLGFRVAAGMSARLN